MRVCGIIAEYDPFHKGHERHLLLAREKSGADYVICVISGSFTQRGAPALLSAHHRAEMALRCGADAVLQLPYAFSVREAEYFALGGVYILNALNCVTHLSFGSETDDLSLLQTAADILEQPDDAFTAALQSALQRGLSFAAAQGQALKGALGPAAERLNAPNAALALSYLRAIRRLGSAMLPVPILRAQDYHAMEMEAYPSASAVRGAILRGDWASVERAIPPAALPVLKRAVREGLCPPDGLDAILRHTLLTAQKENMARWPGMAEGLEDRILAAAKTEVSREALIDAVKTRRYTQGRISRALCHGLLNVTKDSLPALPDHARILGFRESARPLLRVMQKSGFPLITRPARADCAQLDIRADELRAIAVGLPLGDAYRRPPVIV